MFVYLVEKIFRVLNPPRYAGGGTETRTQSGKLRWSFRNPWTHDELVRREEFCQQLMDDEPGFRFASYARDMCMLPEDALANGAKWAKELSSAANTYLAKLDQLHKTKPVVALRIAAIVASLLPKQYILNNEVTHRVCEWIRQDSHDLRIRIELGIFIHENWPLRLRMEDLELAVFDALVLESERDPGYVFNVIGASRLNGDLKFLFSLIAPPPAFLQLGRALKQFDPEFTKNTCQNYLLHGRLNIRSFDPSEDQLTAVATECFELESELPSADAAKAGGVYSSLGRLGPLGAAWYSIAMERLYAAACAINDPIQSAKWFVEVATNSPPLSPLRSLAMERFGAFADSYRSLRVDDRRSVQPFAKLILECIQVASEDNKIGWSRNVCLPSDPEHPIIAVAGKYYWELVDWLQNAQSALALMALVEAVEIGSNPMAEKAASHMADIFKNSAEFDAKEAGASLAELARNTWYSNVKDPRKARCLGLYQQLHPILDAISSEEAKHAAEGLRNPAWDR